MLKKLLLCCLGLSGFLVAQPTRVWEAPLVIPTYELGTPNPLPVFMTGSRRPIYPYPLLDSIGSRKTDHTYKAVFLENEYLRVTVLPEMDGRVYSIYDKTVGKEVLYTNPVVKYAMVGIRGAWISGGIEWNFPDGHTVTTVSPIDYALRTDPDGTVQVTVGDTERIQRMQWAVTVRLRPGRMYVETEVTLNNRRATPGRYWFWSTAAAAAAEDLRFLYPMREAYPHAFWPVFSFPKHNGVDVGTYREVPNALSLFARNSKRDFFAVYYEKSDWGVVHVADHREMPGKKTWTWGTDPAGEIWVDKLTDGAGQYVEFQAGRFETQMEHQFLAPRRVERFIEYWYPLRGMGGGFSEANREGALYVRDEGKTLRVSVSVTAAQEGAELVVESAGGFRQTRSANLMPGKPWTVVLDLPVLPAGRVFTVKLKARGGHELLSYRTDLPLDGNNDFQPAQRPQPDPPVATSAEQAYVRGLAADKKSNERAARAAYEDALRLDPDYAPAHIALGLSRYRSGEYNEAVRHLSRALLRNPDAGDAHYYMGLVLRAQGKLVEAREHLNWCVRSGHLESAAWHELGEMDLAAGDAAEAIRSLWHVDPRDLKARTLLALAYRVTGQLDLAQRAIDPVIEQMPIDYLAYAERREILKVRGRTAEANELWRILGREPDSVLELAFDYLAAGRQLEGRQVLEEAIRRADGHAYPMLHYTLAWLLSAAGQTDAAREQLALGAKGNPEFVFPHRVEELEVLRAAVALNPRDGRASYYLGNVLAALQRGNEALAAWRDAVREDPQNAIAQRNLARGLWQEEGKKEDAAAAYERAIVLRPGEHRLYAEFDELLAAMKATERRIRLLTGAPAAVQAQSSVIQALASAYLAADRYDDAAQLLEHARLTSGEGEGGSLVLYRRAHLGLARRQQQSGNHAQAAAEFVKATEFPRSFGIGAPSMRSQAKLYVAAAREFDAAGDKQQAARWWQRAADEALNPPTQPEEPWSENYYYKAVALDHLGRQAEAHALYQRLANLSDEQKMLDAEASPPRGGIRWLLAGLGLKALGRTDEARAALHKALEIDPGLELAQAELKMID